MRLLAFAGLFAVIAEASLAAMITIEETIVVDAHGRATLTLPPSVKPGRHRAVLQVEEAPAGERAADHGALIGFWRGNIGFAPGWKEPLEDFRPYME